MDELKHLLMVEDIKSYKNFADFKKRVLDKAQEEINELTDIKITFESIRKGRKVIKIRVHITEKTNLEKYAIYNKTNRLLNNE